MKKVIIILTVFLFSCDARNVQIEDFNPERISYFKDSRTNLCFGVTGRVKGASLTNIAESLSFTCVPCDSVKHLIKTEYSE